MVEIRYRLVPTVLLFVLFAAGAFLRFAGGRALISTDLIYAKGAQQKIPGTRTPEDTVRSFYLLVDRGLYEQAWEISVEPNWKGVSFVPYKDEVVAGSSANMTWTGQEEFSRRLEMELGVNGIWLRLHAVQAETLGKCENSSDPALAALFPEAVYDVRATGTLLGACTIFGWDKDLRVVRIDGEYRVFLEGTKAAKSFFYQSWFSNIEKIGTLRPGGS
jgi:hypothetical protein